MSTTRATAAPAAPDAPSPIRGPRWLPRLSRAAWVGWGGVVLGLLAFYLTLPPLLVRNVVPSAVLALVGLTLGAAAIRNGEKRVGWGAIVACASGFAGA